MNLNPTYSEELNISPAEPEINNLLYTCIEDKKFCTVYSGTKKLHTQNSNIENTRKTTTNLLSDLKSRKNRNVNIILGLTLNAIIDNK